MEKGSCKDIDSVVSNVSVDTTLEWEQYESVDGKDQLQVEIGVVERDDFKSKAVVISEGWPSLYFTLKSRGFDVLVFVKTQCDLQFILGDPNIHPLPGQLTGADNNWRPPMCDSVWIQGTAEFIMTYKEILPENTITVLPCTSRKRRFCPVTDHKVYTLSHSNCGGITLGRWTITVPARFDDSSIVKKSLVTRTLRHILNYTVKGIRWGDSTASAMRGTKKRGFNQHSRIYSERDRIIPGAASVPVQVRCVKQGSAEVRRLLTPEELMDVYDIQRTVQDSLQQCKDATRQLIMDDIVCAAPEKVLYGLVEVVRKLFSRGGLKKVDPTPANEPTKVDWLQFETTTDTNDEKAARSDDAAVATEQWDLYLMRGYTPQRQWDAISRYRKVPERWRRNNNSPKVCNGTIVTASHKRMLEGLRSLSVGVFSRNVYRSWILYMNNKYGQEVWSECTRLLKVNTKVSREQSKLLLTGVGNIVDLERDWKAGTEAIRRACNSTFWDWADGSTLFYWRWAPEFQTEARDGTTIWVTGALPRYRARQRWPSEPKAKQKMALKLLKVIDRCYMSQGPVISLTGCFAVPKGDNDIRMVYDATKCGLNEKLWAPNFLLPTIDTALRQASVTSWFGDIDLGEMFLNFPLDEDLRPYAGVDVTQMREELVRLGIMPEGTSERDGRIFVRWVRCLMGLRSSPYNAARAMGWLDDIIRGNRLDGMNEFRWDSLILNLPGMSEYDPALPKVYKWNEELAQMASNFEAYVDDIRTTGGTEVSCVNASRRVASLCNYFGVQDAARKRRFPSTKPSVWCGAKTSSDSTGLYTTTTQEKWDKGRTLILGWITESRENGGWLERKPLERGRGFLVHLSRTYPMIVPFMKILQL